MILTSNALWFRRDVIGGETIKNSSVDWKSGFIPKAYNQLFEMALKGNENLHFVILDELNRADADKAFGDFFTIFSSPVPSKWSISNNLIEEINSYGTNSTSLPSFGPFKAHRVNLLKSASPTRNKFLTSVTFIVAIIRILLRSASPFAS